MNWEKKKILIVVKAYPERSQRHGSVVCMAGLTDDYDWIRIYPVEFNYYIKKLKFKKFTWIEASVQKASEYLMRKESYKVKRGSIRIIDTHLADLSGKSQNSKRKIWAERRIIIDKKLAGSIKDLDNRPSKPLPSLGVIKPKNFTLMFRKPIKDIIIEREKMVQKTIDGTKLYIPDKIEHCISYRFRCNDSNCSCNLSKRKYHDMQCEDWELFEVIRKSTWGNLPEEKERNIRQKFHDDMKTKRDLYFFVGKHSRWGTWIIIGLFYPPKIQEGIDLSKFW